MESIVVGVDDSPASQAALEWVSARCARRPSRVEVVNVVGRLPRSDRNAASLLEDAELRIRELAPDVPIETRIVRGNTAEELTEVARAADLLVIGIDPDRPLAAALGGWLPVRVAARSTVPVCIVPTGWSTQEADAGIAVGLADDDSSVSALELAAAEAGDLGAILHVVHAWREAEFTTDGPAALLSDDRPDIVDHRTHLNEIVSALRARHPGVRIESDLVRATPAEALVRGAKGSAEIVIGTHHQGVFVGGFSGSIAQEVLWQTRSPVRIVPPHREDADAS